MRIGPRLSGAFALYIVLLAGVLVYHVGTIRRSVARGHELTAISARHRVMADDQLSRIADMSNTAEKYLLTHDARYLARFVGLADSFGAEVGRLRQLSLSANERAVLSAVVARWAAVERDIGNLGADSSAAAAAAVLARLEPALDAIALETQRLAAAAQAAMTRELAASERSARDAERIAWGAAAVALALSVLLSLALVRAIVRPLERLVRGTREISAGRLGFRLDGSGRDELGEVAREFNAMTTRLQELDRMKRDFVSNVSHDLKTPLSSMQEATRALLDELAGPLREKQRHLLELSQESGHRLSAMIAKLLDLSRLESSRAPGLASVDLAQIARGAIDRSNDARHGRGPLIVFEAPDHVVLTRGDDESLTQVVDNLLENALKFSPPDGTIRVTVSARESEAIVTVADEGPGIPAAERERVFERFYQTEAGRSVRSRGAGLGLAICRHIVTAHGGTIVARENPLRGAVLVVTLPLMGSVSPSQPAELEEAVA